jgi:hypothetical protein
MKSTSPTFTSEETINILIDPHPQLIHASLTKDLLVIKHLNKYVCQIVQNLREVYSTVENNDISKLLVDAQLLKIHEKYLESTIQSVSIV